MFKQRKSAAWSIRDPAVSGGRFGPVASDPSRRDADAARMHGEKRDGGQRISLARHYDDIR